MGVRKEEVRSKKLGAKEEKGARKTDILYETRQ